ncbi:MAG: sigma-70 family RNA polymerase sigma factor [Planctomycetota bacterium]|jgi:RNA polymerase sigma-70 factor (ECF subfamily)
MGPGAGDLEALVNAHAREVYGLLLAITRNPATAEELTQEVFVVALRKGMRPGIGMRLWLREVARRLAMNELRRKRPSALGGDAELAALPAAGRAGGPAERDFEEELAALRKCMAELGNEDRGVLADRYERGEPLASIAARLSQTEGYIKQRLFRLRRRLAECIRRRLAQSGVARV